MLRVRCPALRPLVLQPSSTLVTVLYDDNSRFLPYYRYSYQLVTVTVLIILLINFA